MDFTGQDVNETDEPDADARPDVMGEGLPAAQSGRAARQQRNRR